MCRVLVPGARAYCVIVSGVAVVLGLGVCSRLTPCVRVCCVVVSGAHTYCVLIPSVHARSGIIKFNHMASHIYFILMNYVHALECVSYTI